MVEFLFRVSFLIRRRAHVAVGQGLPGTPAVLLAAAGDSSCFSAAGYELGNDGGLPLQLKLRFGVSHL